MTRAEHRAAPPSPRGDYPWHTAPPPVADAAPRHALHGRRAGFVTRAVANTVDVVVVVLLVAVGYAGVAVTRFLLHPARFSFPVPGAGTLLLLALCVQAVYFALTWGIAGGTYGDRLMALRVRADGHTGLPWARSAVRAVLCTVFPLGLFWTLVSRENRSVQDVVLRTSVVYD